MKKISKINTKNQNSKKIQRPGLFKLQQLTNNLRLESSSGKMLVFRRKQP